MTELWMGGDPLVLIGEGVENRLILGRARGGPPLAALTIEEQRSLHHFLASRLWAYDSAGKAKRLAEAEHASGHGESD